jgi:hypothetical protein
MFLWWVGSRPTTPTPNLGDQDFLSGLSPLAFGVPTPLLQGNKICNPRQGPLQGAISRSQPNPGFFRGCYSSPSSFLNRAWDRLWRSWPENMYLIINIYFKGWNVSKCYRSQFLKHVCVCLSIQKSTTALVILMLRSSFRLRLFSGISRLHHDSAKIHMHIFPFNCPSNCTMAEHWDSAIMEPTLDLKNWFHTSKSIH